MAERRNAVDEASVYLSSIRRDAESQMRAREEESLPCSGSWHRQLEHGDCLS